MAARLREPGPPRCRPGVATSWLCVLGRLLQGPHVIIILVSVIIYLSQRVTVKIKDDYLLKVPCTYKHIINVSFYFYLKIKFKKLGYGY